MTNLARAVNIEDLRSLAHSRLPQVVFDYIDGGAEAEVTMRENRRAFEAITFRPRQAVSNPARDLGTRVLGHDLSMPILLAPVGYCRVMHPDGESGAARAAGAAGTACILSTVSGHRLEAVKAASTGPMWYQLYLTGGREPGEVDERGSAEADIRHAAGTGKASGFSGRRFRQAVPRAESHGVP